MYSIWADAAASFTPGKAELAAAEVIAKSGLACAVLRPEVE